MRGSAGGGARATSAQAGLRLGSFVQSRAFSTARRMVAVMDLQQRPLPEVLRRRSGGEPAVECIGAHLCHVDGVSHGRVSSFE